MNKLVLIVIALLLTLTIWGSCSLRNSVQASRLHAHTALNNEIIDEAGR